MEHDRTCKETDWHETGESRLVECGKEIKSSDKYGMFFDCHKLALAEAREELVNARQALREAESWVAELGCVL
jgi:hypothetical protein